MEQHGDNWAAAERDRHDEMALAVGRLVMAVAHLEQDLASLVLEVRGDDTTTRREVWGSSGRPLVAALEAAEGLHPPVETLRVGYESVCGVRNQVVHGAWWYGFTGHRHDEGFFVRQERRRVDGESVDETVSRRELRRVQRTADALASDARAMSMAVRRAATAG